MQGGLMGGRKKVTAFGALSVTSETGEVHLSGQPGLFLALLIAGGKDGLSTDQMLNELADGDASKRSQSRLRMTASRLRDKIGKECVPDSQGRYALAPSVAVDAWDLLRLTSEPIDLNDFDAAGLLAGEVLPEVEPTPLVEQLRKEVLSARVSLLRRLVAGPVANLTDDILASSRSMSAHAYLNDSVAELVVDAHIKAREFAIAETFVSNYQLQLEGELGPSALAATDAVVAKLQRARSEIFIQSRLVIPGGVQNKMYGRSQAVAELIDWLDSTEPALVITGPAGSGKTRLLAEAVQLASSRGRTVSYVPASERARAAYGAYRSAFPSLSSGIDEMLGAEGQSDLVRRAHAWNLMAESLGVGATRQSLLVVDDAQWLDSQSSLLTEYLQRSATSEFRLLLAGRSDQYDGDWNRLLTSLARTGARQLELEPLGSEGLYKLISDIHPDSHIGLRRSFAEELLVLSGGLPAIARAVAENADSETLTYRPGKRIAGLAEIVSDLSPEARAVATAAAVLGFEFDVTRLADTCEEPTERVLEVLDQLMTPGHIQQTPDEGRMRFRHVLMRDAFLDIATTATRLRLNAAAAAGESDIHRRAELEDRAFPFLPAARTVRSLLKSAEAHYQSGAYRECAAALRRASQRGGGLSVPNQAMLASCLDRFGESGDRVREKAFEQCRAEGDWDSALDVAIAGLPEGEKSEGDSRRTSLLLAVDSASLSKERRFRHAVECGRQLALVGSPVLAQQWVQKAYDLTTTRQELDDCYRANWIASFVSESAVSRLDDARFLELHVGDEPEPGAQHLRSIDLFGAGRAGESLELVLEAAENSMVRADPHAWWHSLLFRSTLHLAAGELAAAQDLSNEAVNHGQRYGLRDAMPAWLAQQFLQEWMFGSTAPLVEAFELGGVGTEASLLSQAAYAVSLRDAGRLADAREVAEATCDRALKSHTFASLGAIALAGRVAAQLDIQPVTDRALARLKPLGDSVLVLGGGFGSTGPIATVRALMTSGVTQESQVRRALAILDSPRMLGWQVAVRLELARALGPAPELQQEAVRLSANTEMEERVQLSVTNL